MPRIKILAGAPAYEQCLDASGLTVTQLMPVFHNLTAGHVEEHHQEKSPGPVTEQQLFSSPRTAAWRLLPLEGGHFLHTGFSQHSWILHSPVNARNGTQATRAVRLRDYAGDKEVHAAPTAFGETTWMTSSGSTDLEAPASAESQLEESFALHEDALDTTDVMSPRQLSLAPITSGHDRRGLVRSLEQLELAKLSSIPPAHVLDRLYPQTVTHNLLVGVIQVSPMRTVTIKRTGKQADLVELLVGDETRTGFQITIWLDQDTAGSTLRDEMQHVHGGDVVLASNVALRSFGRRVYGQSIGRPRAHRGLASWATRVQVACKSYEMLDAGSLAIPAVLRPVRAWTRRFVGSDARPRARALAAAGQPADDDLPPDDTPPAAALGQAPPAAASTQAGRGQPPHNPPQA